MENSRLYTPEEIANLLRVSPVTVHHWLRFGELKGFKIGSRLWRITHSQLQEFLPEGVLDQMHDGRVR